MSKLNLQIGYIADAIIQTKKNRFNEEYTTIEEVNIVKQVIENRIKQRNLKVKFVDAFFENYFSITNGVITKADNETVSLKPYISSMDIRELIYDEQFIYLCLCVIIMCKLNNSIEHNCSNCEGECTGYLPMQQPNDCPYWSHDFKQDCIEGLSIEERTLIAEGQSQSGTIQKLVKKEAKHN